MERGDLSNKMAPAIILNAELLFDLKKKRFGRTELNFLHSHRPVLERWFLRNDLTVYIVCTGEFLKQQSVVESLLDSFMVPYTQVISIRTTEELAGMVEMEHVVGYFYLMTAERHIRMNVRKHYQVPNLAEAEFILEGGTRL